MKSTLRLLAAVKPGRFLEPGNPTGLTGLLNHPAPRSTLLYIYGSTLEKLKSFPEHSVYRQSTEAITKHRRDIIQAIKPKGYEEWRIEAAKTVEKHPEIFRPGDRHLFVDAGGASYLTREKEPDDKEQTSSDVSRTQKGKVSESRLQRREMPRDPSKAISWKPEPPLEATQYTQSEALPSDRWLTCCSRISDAETQIGGGLIEEVIEVAEGELKLVDTMFESRV